MTSWGLGGRMDGEEESEESVPVSASVISKGDLGVFEDLESPNRPGECSL